VNLLEAIKLLEDNIDFIRTDGPTHRRMTKLAESYLYESLQQSINNKSGD
jgi:hypothetical protein